MQWRVVDVLQHLERPSMPFHALEKSCGWIPWSKGWAATTEAHKENMCIHTVFTLIMRVAMNSDPFGGLTFCYMDVIIYKAFMWLLRSCNHLGWGWVCLCVTAGAQITECCSLCIRLLLLLAAVLPTLQPGIRAGLWNDQMQTDHEGIKVILVIQSPKWHHCTG